MEDGRFDDSIRTSSAAPIPKGSNDKIRFRKALGTEVVKRRGKGKGRKSIRMISTPKSRGKGNKSSHF